MYYYVFESPKGSKEKKLQEKIKNLLGDFGIIGEVTSASPARSSEELVGQGLEKGYSTIVAVGSDRHIHRVLSSVVGASQKDVALGVVPTSEKSLVAQKLNLKNLKEAAEALRGRHLITPSLAYVLPNRYLLTSASISSLRPFEIYLEVDNWSTTSYVTKVTITGELNVTLVNEAFAPAKLKHFTYWFLGKKVRDLSQSIFHGKTVRMTTSQILPLISDGEVIAKTPLTCYKKLNALKLIAPRAKVEQGEKNSPKS